MQKTKIEWCDYVWNITTGCTRNCFYCYAKMMDKRFKNWNNFFPTYHPDSLNDIDKLKKPSRIFVSSMGDLFDYHIANDTVSLVLKKIKQNPQHTFIILTKNPRHIVYNVYDYPNIIWGASITQKQDINKNLDQYDTSYILTVISNTSKYKKVISFEPLIEKIDKVFLKKYLMSTCSPIKKLDWVILGGMTGQYARQYPMQKEWVDEIVSFCKDRENPIPLFFKGWGTAKMKKTDPEYYLIDGKEYKEFPK